MVNYEDVTDAEDVTLIWRGPGRVLQYGCVKNPGLQKTPFFFDDFQQAVRAITGGVPT